MYSIVKNFCFENIYSNVSTGTLSNNGTNMNKARILLLKSKKNSFPEYLSMQLTNLSDILYDGKRKY